jgi:hypothetical protein
VIIHVPVRTINELNATRWHWRKRQKTREEVKEAVTYALLGHDWSSVEKPTRERPWSVRLVRLGKQRMDDDGVVSSLKSVRDAFAKFINVDDKHRDIVAYGYEQEYPREFGVRIEVTVGREVA